MVRPLYWNGSKEEHLMHAISRSGRALLLGTMLGTLLVVPMLADQKGVVLSADGERQLIDLPASAFGGIPHDPSAQGGSPGSVMPILVSTDWFPAKPIFREPFRLSARRRATKLRHDLNRATPLLRKSSSRRSATSTPKRSTPSAGSTP
jgi:hypothetical protein